MFCSLWLANFTSPIPFPPASFFGEKRKESNQQEKPTNRGRALGCAHTSHPPWKKAGKGWGMKGWGDEWRRHHTSRLRNVLRDKSDDSNVKTFKETTWRAIWVLKDNVHFPVEDHDMASNVIPQHSPHATKLLPGNLHIFTGRGTEAQTGYPVSPRRNQLTLGKDGWHLWLQRSDYDVQEDLAQRFTFLLFSVLEKPGVRNIQRICKTSTPGISVTDTSLQPTANGNKLPQVLYSVKRSWKVWSGSSW